MAGRVAFDPKVSLGNVLTIAGGVLALIVAAVTLYVESGAIKIEQARQASRMETFAVRQQAIAESVARIEGRFLANYPERRRAELYGPAAP
jgi:hypothetical protein